MNDPALPESKRVIRETTPEAIALARSLIRQAQFGTLATIATDGWPMASRVGVGTDADGTPVVLISRLAAHTTVLLADPRCSLLLGEPGKGDPLAHPRVTLSCEAREVARDGEAHRRIGPRYLAHQPKAELYVGFTDFSFFRLEPKSVALNGGFGKAYVLRPADILD